MSFYSTTHDMHSRLVLHVVLYDDMHFELKMYVFSWESMSFYRTTCKTCWLDMHSQLRTHVVLQNDSWKFMSFYRMASVFSWKCIHAFSIVLACRSSGFCTSWKQKQRKMHVVPKTTNTLKCMSVYKTTCFFSCQCMSFYTASWKKPAENACRSQLVSHIFL